jgi:hypothetical protein
LQSGEIALTQWAADDLSAQIGDRIQITYFEPESPHGEEREATAEFRVARIVPLTEPNQPYRRRTPAIFADRPTPANDPDLTPEVKGITDQESINLASGPRTTTTGKTTAPPPKRTSRSRTAIGCGGVVSGGSPPFASPRPAA